MVIGVPNSGKSTIINNLAGQKKTQTANKPGVTRHPQWVEAISTECNIVLYLLDTPGILWPNLEDQNVAKNLAYIGSIRDDVLDIVELSRELLTVIKSTQTLEDFAKSRGHILSGGRLDLERAAKTLLTEFRSGKLGKYNLD